MSKSPELSNLYTFGDFRLDASERRLFRGETAVALAPKTFDLLLFLVENEGRLLRKDDLLTAVWPDATVEENNLTVAVSALRKAFGESEGKRYIETIPKSGYRFVAPVAKFQSDKQGLDDGLGSASAPLLSPGPTRTTIASNYGLLALTLLIVVLSTFGYFALQKRNTPKRTAGSPRRLAILPFRDLRGNAEDRFLSLSLADAVIARLGNIRELTVRPLYDVQKYAAQNASQAVDLPKVAADLDVDTVLTGTYIHEEDNLRIAGQLVDVRTRDILWKGLFDLKYNKLLTVQEKVAQQIVRGLELSLSPSEAARLKATEAIDPLAYEYYLRGVDLYAKNDFLLAARVLEKSLELAPNYAPSWANLGRAYTAGASFQFGGDEVYRKAEAAFARAVALQPDAIDARVYMANMFTDTGRVEKAVPLLRAAVKANPSHAESHWELGYAYRFAGMLEESVSECERARRLDPGVKLNSSTLNSYLYLGLYNRFLESLPSNDDFALILFYRGFGEYYRKNNQEAMRNFDRAFALDHSMFQTRVGKALSFAIGQQRSEAISVLRTLESKVNSRGAYDPEAVYKIAQAYAVLGDKASALRVMRHSIENGFFPYSYLLTDPLLDNVRSGAEFPALLDIARRRHEAFKNLFF